MVELRALFTGEPEMAIRATPGHGADVEMWMLGSSLFGASLAAQLGLPYAFASHFAPDHLDGALAVYRRDFQPSAALAMPHVMVAMNLFVADTAEEANFLASSQMQAFVRLRTGQPGKLPPPVEGYRASLPDAGADDARSYRPGQRRRHAHRSRREGPRLSWRAQVPMR